ncbi:MAG TPA: reverse transcriptase domain-containing protein [Labilithrix sp.]|nr:reverse transcriptase domain-containing protein [Labilithrix sp.]
MSFVSALTDAARWRRQFDRLIRRVRGRRFDALIQDGVRFAELVDERERVMRLARRAVADASYRPSPAVLGRAQIGGKERELARIGAIDLLVHAVVADALSEAFEPRLSPQLYSFRRGRSSWQAIRWLGRVAAAHRAEVTDVKARGVYVLRSDVQSYTDSIPLDDDAPLWRDLAEAIGLAAENAHFRMLVRLLRPEIVGQGPRHRGLMFGAPTTNVLANLYLAPLDAELEAAGAYARFGDDVLFADRDPDCVRSAVTTLERTLSARGLRPNPTKLRVHFWNGAARPSAVWPDAHGTSHVAFLGAAIGFDGTVRLSPANWAKVLSDLRARIQRTAKLVRDEPPRERARILSSVVNEALDVRSPVATRAAELVFDLVSDRAQLAELDYLLARWIAEEATGTVGPRAFREIPWRWLRLEGGLASRVVMRNRGRAPGTSVPARR